MVRASQRYAAVGTGFGFSRLLQTHAATAVLQEHYPFGALSYGVGIKLGCVHTICTQNSKLIK